MATRRAAVGQRADVEAGASLDDDDDKYDIRAKPHDATAASSFDGVATWIFLGIGLFTRFYGLKWPAQVVFDEVHFGKFVNGYITGRYFFDIHPPLGKLLIALVAYSYGYDGTQPFDHIGEAYHANVNLFALRVAPATFGALLVPLVYVLARRMGTSQPAAVLAAGIVLFDGAALVESRLLLTDALLFLFELAQLYGMAALSDLPTHGRAFHATLAFTGATIGAAISTKWTALATMAIVGLHTVHALLHELAAALAAARAPPSSPPLPDTHALMTFTSDSANAAFDVPSDAPPLACGGSSASAQQWPAPRISGGCAPADAGSPFSVLVVDRQWRRRHVCRALSPVLWAFSARFVWLLLLPLSIYGISFVLHIRLLPLSGPGDAFHDARFTCRLRVPPTTNLFSAWGTPSRLPIFRPQCAGVQTLSFFEAIVALNRRMLSANASIRKGHAFGSGWLHWPLNSKPVFYWKRDLPDLTWCRIYMAGNPIAWLLCFAGFLHLSLRTVVLLSITVAHRWREPLSHLLGARRGLGFSSTRPCWQSQADSEAADAGATGGGGAAGSGGDSNGGGSSAGGDACGDGECTQPASLSHGVGASSASEHVARNRYGWLLLAGHLIAWLPFAWVTRVAFLYHYIPAFLLTVLATALSFDALTHGLAHVRVPLMRCGASASARTALAAVLLVLVGASSWYFAPLYLGWPLHPDDVSRRTRHLDFAA